MKLVNVSLVFATLALGVASAASAYSVNIPSDVWAGDTQLKAGIYKVTMEGSTATFKLGKQTISVPATVEATTSKVADTALESAGTKLQAIDLGGTKTKIVFKADKTTSTPAQ